MSKMKSLFLSLFSLVLLGNVSANLDLAESGLKEFVNVVSVKDTALLNEFDVLLNDVVQELQKEENADIRGEFLKTLNPVLKVKSFKDYHTRELKYSVEKFDKHIDHLSDEVITRSLLEKPELLEKIKKLNLYLYEILLDGKKLNKASLDKLLDFIYHRPIFYVKNHKKGLAVTAVTTAVTVVALVVVIYVIYKLRKSKKDYRETTLQDGTQVKILNEKEDENSDVNFRMPPLNDFEEQEDNDGNSSDGEESEDEMEEDAQSKKANKNTDEQQEPSILRDPVEEDETNEEDNSKENNTAQNEIEKEDNDGNLSDGEKSENDSDNEEEYPGLDSVSEKDDKIIEDEIKNEEKSENKNEVIDDSKRVNAIQRSESKKAQEEVRDFTEKKEQEEDFGLKSLFEEQKEMEKNTDEKKGFELDKLFEEGNQEKNNQNITDEKEEESLGVDILFDDSDEKKKP